MGVEETAAEVLHYCNLAAALGVAIFAGVTGTFVIRLKHLEFNAIWNTRLALVVVAAGWVVSAPAQPVVTTRGSSTTHACVYIGQFHHSIWCEPLSKRRGLVFFRLPNLCRAQVNPPPHCPPTAAADPMSVVVVVCRYLLFEPAFFLIILHIIRFTIQ